MKNIFFASFSISKASVSHQHYLLAQLFRVRRQASDFFHICFTLFARTNRHNPKKSIDFQTEMASEQGLLHPR